MARFRPGTQAQLVAKEGREYALLKLPSGETRKVLAGKCTGERWGQVGNTEHENILDRQSGTPQALDGHPAATNRGVSMNPVDHPHGGGEGKTSGRTRIL